MCLLRGVDVWHDDRYWSKVFSIPPPPMRVTYRSRSRLNFLNTFCVEVFKILHQANLLFSLVNMSNILCYTIFTHACDLEVNVMDIDNFHLCFCKRICDLISSTSCVGFGLYVVLLYVLV